MSNKPPQVAPIHADVNNLAEHVRLMQGQLQDQSQIQSEFSDFLAKDLLHAYILKTQLQKLGYELEENKNAQQVRKGIEWFITDSDEKISINLEFSPIGRFEIVCNDKGDPIQTDETLNYFVFMTLRFIFFVKPKNVKLEVSPEDIKVGNDGSYKYYWYNLNQVKANSEQVIQFANLIVW